MRIEHPGGGVVRGEALTIDISATGLRLLWPGYTHVGTSCQITLRTRAGGTHDVQGVVVWCRFVQGRFHTIGVRLSHRIDLREYVDPRLLKTIASASDSAHVAPLQGRVLCVHPDPLYHDLLTMLLADTKLTVDHVATSGEALDDVRVKGVDAVIIEVTENRSSAMEFIQSARREGYTGPIIALLPESASKHEQALLAAGVCAIIPQPVSSELLHDALKRAILECADPSSGTAPIASTLPNAALRAPWITKYVAEIQQRGREIHEAAGAGKPTETRNLCEGIAVTGEGYGFLTLSQAALAARKAIDASCSTEEAMPAIRALLRIIARLKAPTPPPEEGAVATQLATAA